MIKTGVDIVLNARFNRILMHPQFPEKIFHSSELRERDKLTSIFALKEATMKALGQKVHWKDIEVKYEGEKPMIFLEERLIPKRLKNIDASVGQDGGYTIAFVVLEIKG